jgi:hypothetical protein
LSIGKEGPVLGTRVIGEKQLANVLAKAGREIPAKKTHIAWIEGPQRLVQSPISIKPSNLTLILAKLAFVAA